MAVLIGGDSKHHRMSPAVQTYLIERLESLHVHGVSLMITVSRRTPDSLVQRLKDRLGEAKRVWLHTGDGSNPYFAFLKHADWILVTEDSTFIPNSDHPRNGRAGRKVRSTL